jgi:transposase-like protein
VIGARENDRYVCKDCGHGFAIKLSLAAKGTADEMKRNAA